MSNFSAKNGEARDCWRQGLGMPIAFDGLSLEGRLSLPCMQLIEVKAIFRTIGSGWTWKGGLGNQGGQISCSFSCQEIPLDFGQGCELTRSFR